MNDQLANAFRSLRNAGAQNLPSAEEVDAAANDAYWTGQKKDGGSWVLTKNRPDSFNVTV